MKRHNRAMDALSALVASRASDRLFLKSALNSLMKRKSDAVRLAAASYCVQLGLYPWKARARLAALAFKHSVVRGQNASIAFDAFMSLFPRPRGR